MDSAFQELLLRQAPIVILLIAACFLLYKIIFFLLKKIESKDLELKAERTEVMILYGKAIESNNKTNEALTKNAEIQKELLNIIHSVKLDLSRIEQKV